MVNSDMKKILENIKAAQDSFQTLLKKQDWIEEARKYAEKQSMEVRKLFASDVNRVKAFLEKERKDLLKFQKQIPGEVKKLRARVEAQTKEFERLLDTLRKSATGTPVGAKKGKTTRKKTPVKASAKSPAAKKKATGSKKGASSAASA